MACGGGGVGGARCGFVLIIGLDEGGCDDVLDEDGESMPCAERIEDEEGACCVEGRGGGRCCGIWYGVIGGYGW